MPLKGQAGRERAADRCRGLAVAGVVLAAGLCSLSLLAAQPGAPSSVIINEEVRHYAIKADSLDELRDWLRHDVPGRGVGTHGRTWSDVRIAYELDRSGEGCRIRNLRSEEHTSELQSLMRISYAVFCLQKKTKQA